MDTLELNTLYQKLNKIHKAHKQKHLELKIVRELN